MELGVFLYELKDGQLATMEDFENLDHENEIFGYEPVWLIEENGEYDLDFLQGSSYIYADTFSELLADYTTYIKWLGEGN